MSQARVFQCPTCKEFIASDATSCRFCKAPIDAQTAAKAADSQEQDNRTYRKKQYSRHMMIGAGLFVLGLFITIGSAVIASAAGANQSIITFGLILAGAGDFLYGFVGWLGELRK